jgi:hypothetical protein
MVVPMFGRPERILAACATLALAGLAADTARAGDPPLEPVDTGITDRSPAAEQLRVMPVELSPHRFDLTYRVPGRSDLLMRKNGEVYIVFDNMVYQRDKRFKNQMIMKGMIPPSSVFYIGRPDFSRIRSTGIRLIDPRVDKEKAPIAPSAALESVHGVGHVREERLGPQLEMGSKQRANTRIEGERPAEFREVNRDISYPPTPHRGTPRPAEDANAPATHPAGDAAHAPDGHDVGEAPGARAGAEAGSTGGAPTDSTAAPAGRATLNRRMDDLVRRASKGT